jgi:hypothetical protein
MTRVTTKTYIESTCVREFDRPVRLRPYVVMKMNSAPENRSDSRITSRVSAPRPCLPCACRRELGADRFAGRRPPEASRLHPHQVSHRGGGRQAIAFNEPTSAGNPLPAPPTSPPQTDPKSHWACSGAAPDALAEGRWFESLWSDQSDQPVASGSDKSNLAASADAARVH